MPTMFSARSEEEDVQGRHRGCQLSRLTPSKLARLVLMAAAFSILAALVRLALMPLTGSGAPYLVFFGAVLLASCVVDSLCGILTAVCSGVLATWLFSYHAGFSSLELIGQYMLFLVEGSSAAWLTGGFFSWRRAALRNLRALRTSEERYQLALQATSDLLRDWRAADDHMEFGEGLVASMGYPESCRTTTRAWWLAHIHPEDRHRIDASLAEATAQQKNLWAAEYRFAAADGRYIDVLDKAYLVFNRQGGLKRVIGAMQDITRRRNDQRVLRAAEGKLRLITDSLPAIVCYLDDQRHYRFVNAEWERWFREPRSHLLGKTTEEWGAGGPFVSGKFLAAIEAAMGGTQSRVEGTIDLPNKPGVPVLCTIVPDFDDEQQVRGIVCLISDMTEQKQNDRSLRESEEHYRVLAEVVPQIIFEARADGQVAYANSRWARYTGLLPAQLLGDGWADAVHPEQRTKTLKAWRNAVLAEHEYETEMLLRCSQKSSWRWHLLRALAVCDDKGRVRRWIGCLVDIHERKKAEQELQTLADFIPQLAWVASPQGDVYWLNQRWYDYSGQTLAKLQGKAWLDQVAEPHRERIANALNRAFSNAQAFEDTFPIVRADGELRWFLTRAIPITDDAGHLSRWFGTSTDINDQLEAKNRLMAAQAELQTAVRARDEFLSIASHELKTPLTSLQLVAQMAGRNLLRDAVRACEPQRVRKLIVQTEKSVERLTRLVDDMLDTSRIAMGKLSFKFEEFDLAELVEEVVERIAPQVQAAGGSINILRRCCAKGRWDRFRLEQVVLNLLTNAIRYGAGSPIDVTISADEERAAFAIRDHGPGIAADHQERIFQQYERATPHSSISGLGLGLFICREIVERHGGRIELDSEVGDGAAFAVTLPKCSREALRNLVADQKSPDDPLARPN